MDGSGEHRRHPTGKGSTGEGKDGPKDTLRNGLNRGRGGGGRNIGVERLGGIKREEIGKKTGGVGGRWGGARDGVGGGVASYPGRENVKT